MNMLMKTKDIFCRETKITCQNGWATDCLKFPNVLTGHIFKFRMSRKYSSIIKLFVSVLVCEINTNITMENFVIAI